LAGHNHQLIEPSVSLTAEGQVPVYSGQPAGETPKLRYRRQRAFAGGA
jgi:hypothetical protein